MGVFTFLSYSTQSVQVKAAGSDMFTINETQVSASSQLPESSTPTKPNTISENGPAAEADPNASSTSEPPNHIADRVEEPLKNNKNQTESNTQPDTQATFSVAASEPARAKFPRTLFHKALFSRSHDKHKPALSKAQESAEKAHVAAAASSRPLVQLRISTSDRKAKKSALVVKSLILGPDAASPKLTTANAKPQLSKVKSQLIEPKSAQKVIAQLRALPTSEAGDKALFNVPIRAVCLEHPDAEEDKLHFANLATPSPEGRAKTTSFFDVSSSIDQVAAMFQKMNVVSLIKSPDLGLGQPGDGDGLLAGAVPTAETVLRGFEEITPQLMALGYATGKAIAPVHTGIYPPKDRLSVLTYWWGLEVLLPPPSLEHLADVHSIAGNIVNFLTALSLINNGVREIIPFVRYIAQFIDFEFNTIKAQDKGQGVVCAATWIMPAAMVPRPWDFPDPPADPPRAPIENPGTSPAAPTSPEDSQALPTSPPVILPPSLPTFADSIVRAYADSVHFQTAVPPEPPNAGANP